MTVRQEQSLPEGLQLQGYRILQKLAFSDIGFVYLAAEPETGTLCRILEWFPPELAHRNGTEVLPDEASFFDAQKEIFLQRAQILQNCRISGCPAVLSVFEQSGTAYCVLDCPETVPLSRSEIPLTAGYLRSLGIMLCDMYMDLHKAGLGCAALSGDDLLFEQNGAFQVNPVLLFTCVKDPVQEIHGLTAFLRTILPDAEESAEADLLRAVLRYTYQNAAQLKSALICADGTVTAPRNASPQKRTIICAAVCLLFLTGSVLASTKLLQSRQSLRYCLDTGKLSAETIEVWMPLPEGADEEETVAMYEKLSRGFVRQYPELNVHITVYADDSFAQAVSQNGMNADVFMGTRSPEIMAMAADLSPLTEMLEDRYLTDMQNFHEYIPLGCSFPAAFYHLHAGSAPEKDTLTFEELGELSGWDDSAAGLAERLGKEMQPDAFEQFLDMPAQTLPVMASTAQLAKVQKTAAASGDLRMVPVSCQGEYLLQYECCCTVNKNATLNRRRIGMLWLHYLLTEEAQHILFVEHYSALPLEENTFEQTIAVHKELQIAGEIRNTPEQEGVK